VEHVVLPLLPAGARAWLIGSLAWGDFGERSDVDLVLSAVTDQESTAIEQAALRAGGAEVDLLRFEELPAEFRERIAREGRAIRGL
jgi:predicted nucleotidyltransferase